MSMNARTLAAFSDELGKIAGVVETMKRPDVYLPILGASALGAAQYLANRAPKGGRSGQERIADEREWKLSQSEKERKRTGEKPGFGTKFKRVQARTARDYADYAKKNPGKAAIPAALIGALSGRRLARAIT
jgi:hypothetical protein